ncbi:hypothetical protein BD414DRAFT_11128 [Trametes punicea]|nr:hypothetical protein BD414DRAFT_11128 [Trametes punicea]
MYTTPPRRGLHRKRLSALRLSSDSTVTTLPLYTSPPRLRHPDLPDIPSEQPPAYSDSAEEADEDTDPSDDPDVFIPSPPPSLPVSPRPSRRPRAAYVRGHRRQQSIANVNASDPYLDSLLERSVHALEMSNALLQSSMSTQTSLSAVLSDDAIDADRSLEQRAQALTSRIRSNRDLHDAWMLDLDRISRGIVPSEDDDDDSNLPEGHAARPPQEPISQSLPTGGLSERIQRRQGRRASQDFRQASGSSRGSGSKLQLSAHDRNAFVAPPPRAITMYIDSTEAADAIALPSTLGVRPASRPPPTPLPSQASFSSGASEPEPPSHAPEERSRRVVDMLASYVMPRNATKAPSVSSSPSSSLLRRRDSSSSSQTVKKHRPSRSPPPPLQLDTPSSSTTGSLRSRSLTPSRGSPVVRQARPLTPPIEELSTSSTSSDSHTLHVDRTVESLRQILEKQQRTASQSSAGAKGSSSAAAAPVLPRPSLLSPPVVAPVSGTSTATASVSRLFTKARHTSSTRPPCPPKQSSMKGRSAPSTPISPSPSSSLPALTTAKASTNRSPSLLSVPDVFGGVFGRGGRSPGASSSGASTPKRISFAEPPEAYSSSKGGASSSFSARFRSRGASGEGSGGGDRPRGRGRSAVGGGKSKGKGKGKARARSAGRVGDGDDSEGEEGEKGVGWWAGWLLGAAGTGPGMGGEGGRARSEERYVSAGSGLGGRGVGLGLGAGGTWAMRPGFGSSLEEWGA